MATVYLCDRCGKSIEPKGLFSLIKSKVYYTKVDFIPAKSEEGSSWTVGKSRILCDECGLSFVKWWTAYGKEETA